jgi:TonB family protein
MRRLPVTLGIILIAASASHAFAQQPAQTPKPVAVADEVSQPTLVRRVRPVYPPIAEAGKVQGVVVLKATVDPTGKVRTAEIVRSPNQFLSEAALSAIRQWEYRPATVKGVPISADVNVEIPFYSSDKSALPLPPRPKK